jgi:cystathionine beta-lyase
LYSYDKVYDRTDTNSEKYTLRKKLYGTDNLIPMWVADMDIATADFIVKALQKRLKHPILGYEEFPNSAKEAQIKWIEKNHNFTIKKKWIFYSHSVVSSINLAIQAFTDVGDEVIVQPPVYFPFFSAIKNNKRDIIENHLIKNKQGEYTFNYVDLESKITPKTKLLLLCSPANPVGRVWSKKELSKLGEICLKHNIKVFSDEIHSDLVYGGFRHIPFASLSKKIKDITILAYGVGKTFNLSGMAISTVVIPNKLMRKRFKAVYDSSYMSNGNILGHIAFETAYKNGQKWKDGLVSELSKNLDMLENMLKKHQDKVKFQKPQGTYLAWLDCSGMGLNDTKLKDFFINEAKLGISMGILFGTNGTLYIRLNFAVPTKTMVKAINQLDTALSKYLVK